MMPTSVHTCDTCKKEHETYAKAEECEQDHQREYIKDEVISKHGTAVWKCVCEIEKWKEQKNWQAPVAYELADLMNGKFEEAGVTHDNKR